MSRTLPEVSAVRPLHDNRVNLISEFRGGSIVIEIIASERWIPIRSHAISFKRHMSELNIITAERI